MSSQGHSSWGLYGNQPFSWNSWGLLSGSLEVLAILPRVLYSSAANDFYLSGNNRTYILSGDKLGASRNLVASLQSLEDVTYGVKEGVISEKLDVLTIPQDVNRRALKLIKNIDIDFENLTDVEVCIWYRYSESETWRQSPWRSPNKEGITWHMIACVDFKVRVRADATEVGEGHLNSLQVRYTPLDMRGLKGLTEQGTDYA